MKIILLLLCLVTISSGEFYLKKYMTGLTQPISLIETPRGIIVAEQTGLIFSTDRSYTLDLTEKVYITSEFDRKGLLSIASQKKRLFAAYVTLVGDEIYLRISAFDLYDKNQVENIIIDIPQQDTGNHGGHIFFDQDSDSTLFITVGDNGQGDKSQDLTSFLGKILRIDVSHKKGYSIPRDNPYKNSHLGEIYAYGLRNPWRCYQDIKYGIICGDPGSNIQEEINKIDKGGNYGWNITEGYECRVDSCCDYDFSYPLEAYDHITGGTIIGGVAARKFFYDSKTKTAPYLFADIATGLKFYNFESGEIKDVSFSEDDIFPIISFGMDYDENIYILTSELTLDKKTAVIYKLKEKKEEKQKSSCWRIVPGYFTLGVIFIISLILI